MCLCRIDTFLDEFLSKIGIFKAEDVFTQNDWICQVVGIPLTNTLQVSNNDVAISCIVREFGEA